MQSVCPARHWCFSGVVPPGAVAAATESTGEDIRLIDLLEEALDDLLRFTPPGDIEVRFVGIRGRWLLDATIRWRGAALEDTSSVSLEMGVGLRITSVGRPP